MSSNIDPYRPPSAELSAQEEFHPPHFKPSKIPAIISAVILATIGAASSLSGQAEDQKLSAAYAFASSVIAVVYAIYTVFLLNHMANGPGENGETRWFGWWGFLWRAFLAHVLCLIPIGVVTMVFFGFGAELTAARYVFSTISGFVFLPAVIWLAFSNKRREQVMWLRMLVARL